MINQDDSCVRELMQHYKSLFDFYKSECGKAEIQANELQKVILNLHLDL